MAQRRFFINLTFLFAKACFVLTIVIGLSACGDESENTAGNGGNDSGGSQSSVGEVLYVTNLGSNSISAFTINATTGVLTGVPNSPFAITPGAFSMGVDPRKKFVYTGTTAGNYITTYAIDGPTGALSEIARAPSMTIQKPMSIAITAGGEFIYGVNDSSNSLSAYSVSNNGALAEVAGTPFQTGQKPAFVTLDPSGAFAYVANEDGDSISAFGRNATTGALSEVPGSPFATRSRPRAIAIDPTAKFLYVGTSVGVFGFTIESSGALTPVPGGSGFGAQFIIVDPSGKYLYATNGFGIAGHTINVTTGTLTLIPSFPFDTASRHKNMVMAGSGKFLYALDNLSNKIVAYVVDSATGTFKDVVPGSPYSLVPGTDVGQSSSDMEIAR